MVPVKAGEVRGCQVCSSDGKPVTVTSWSSLGAGTLKTSNVIGTRSTWFEKQLPSGAASGATRLAFHDPGTIPARLSKVERADAKDLWGARRGRVAK